MRPSAVDISFYTYLLDKALNGLLAELSKNENVKVYKGVGDARFLFNNVLLYKK